MQRYRLSSGSFDTWKASRIRRSLLIGGSAVAAGIALHAGISLFVSHDEPAQLAISVLGTVVIALVIFAVVLRRAVGRWKEEWDAYELFLSEGSVRRVALGVEPVEILWSEVTRITENTDGTLLISTENALRFVAVPPQLESFTEVRERLHAFHPIEPHAARSTLGWLIAILQLGLWIATGLLPDVRHAVVAGALLVALTIGLLRSTWKNPNVTRQAKRAIAGVMIFVMLAPFARVALHLMQGALVPPSP